MNNDNPSVATKALPRLSLDTWAVLIALLAATLIRLGAISHVPW